jgi:Fe-S cluster biogenesis protein NfuA
MSGTDIFFGSSLCRDEWLRLGREASMSYIYLMFIQTEATPNPATIKFIPGQPVLEKGSADFATPDSAVGRSPLAERLFRIDGVKGVFFGSDFVSVTKADAKEWLTLKPLILGALFEHLSTRQPILIEMPETPVSSGEDSELVLRIKDILNEQVRPAVARDGGDIIFVDYNDGIVFLRMHGACSGCPSSAITLKAGIENMLRYYIPEVQEVRAVQD